MVGRAGVLGRLIPGAAALALLLSGLWAGVLVTPGWAAPVAGTLKGSPVGKVVVGERVRLTGSLPPARARQITLQSRVGSAGWLRLVTTRSKATGRFAFTPTIPSVVGQVVRYRVVAPAATVRGHRYPARQTPMVTYRTVAPLALLTSPTLVAEGRGYTVTARFQPARTGRPVVLERLAGQAWVEAGHGVQDATGSVSFAITTGAEEVATVRAWAQAWHGAARVGTEPAAIRVTSRLGAGYHHTCVVRLDGTAWCWGWNLLGQLGDGSYQNRATPVRVGSSTDWVSVAAGAHHTCGLHSDGSLWCWGSNYYGQLGDGSNQSSTTPVQVPGSWLGLDVGAYHSCAVGEDESAWCWGQNTYGQLGAPTTGDSNSPVAVDSAGPWRSLRGGYAHTCGVRADGTAWCWGANDSGQLGDGGTTQSPVPVRVGVESDWVTLTAGAGGGQTCGVRGSGSGVAGTAWCWGFNGLGLLGNGTQENSPTPVRVGVSDDWLQLAVGGYQACGVRGSGTAWCWGMNQYGQLGNGTTTSSTSPVPVLGSNWGTRTDAGNAHACALASDGAVWCWGRNEYGQIGDGTTGDRSGPTAVALP